MLRLKGGAPDRCLSTDGWPFPAAQTMKSIRGCPTATCDPKESFTIFGDLALQTQPFAHSRRDCDLGAVTSTL
jgi:hypothetical protein